MATARGTWKAAERRIAAFFGTQRTSLSGGNSKLTRSDTMHKALFIEAKLRVRHAAVQLWRDTKALADKERKLPVVCLNEKNKPGFWILCHSDDFVAVADMVRELGYVCHECASALGGVWPSDHAATHHPGVCPECGKQQSLASVDDWNWPNGSRKPALGAGRD